jgi:hypothetical protein
MSLQRLIIMLDDDDLIHRLASTMDALQIAYSLENVTTLHTTTLATPHPPNIGTRMPRPGRRHSPPPPPTHTKG